MTVIYRVRTQLNYGAGGPGLLTHYFIPGTPGGSTSDALDAANRVRGFCAALALYLPVTASALVLPNIDTIQDTNGGLVGGFSVTPPAIVVGTGTGSNLPPTTCIVVRYTGGTIVGTRRLSGRSYFGPLSSNASTAAGAPTTGVGTNTATAVAALTGGAGTVLACIWHRPKSGAGGTSGAITGGNAWSLFGSLRSRRD